MEEISKFVFWVSAFIIFWAMIGYPLSIITLDKILKPKKNKKNYSILPTVTVMVVAHNEEKVIKEKLKNIVQLDYPSDKIEFLVSSDNSTDKTNEIVQEFISNNSDYNITLYKVKKRMGKTNAQNEAQKTVTSDILVMTDANSILEKNSVIELVSSFSDDTISYVAGRLVYLNDTVNQISASESSYWSLDLRLRDIESRFQTITAGNGALYACRNERYFEFDPIRGHDGAMPKYYAQVQQRAIMNPDAIAYEKAGETQEDEFNRKIRMNRNILLTIYESFKFLNIFKYKWFAYFYFGHRTCRYLLWLAHGDLFLLSYILRGVSNFYLFIFVIQIVFYLLAFLQQILKKNKKLLSLINYYVMTIMAQWVGVYNGLTGKNKPFWEKAESTR